jgi:predicted O-methyltransferase YrrM
METPANHSRALPRLPFERLEIRDRGTSISESEASFLQGFLAGRRPKATLEVGMGYGLSAAAILSATDCPHHAMDPLQHEYGDLGLRNVEALGFADRLRFHREYSHAALPRLLAGGLRVDFAFIDGGHRFDEIFLDVYYADLLLEQGGHVVLHDAWMRSTATVASWIRKNKPNFRPVPAPERNLVVFRKEGVDDRPWNHFRGFGTWRSLWSHSLNTFKRRVKAAIRPSPGEAASAAGAVPGGR